MHKKSSVTLKQIILFFVFVMVFILVSFIVRHYGVVLVDSIRAGGIVGLVAFVLLTAVFVICIIPLDIIVLIPVGVAVWGSVLTAFLSIAGWTLGAAIAFIIARRLGVGIVQKIVGLERIHAAEQRIPKHNLFWSVVLLRMLVSVDILSYVLGLFSVMSWRQYILATAIGVTPFGFYFAYAGALPFWYQVLAMGAALILVTVVVVRYRIRI